MRAFFASILVATALFAGAPATAQNAQLVYKIDGAHAKIVNRRLVISAYGAVNSGGWRRPQLELRKAYAPETTTLEVKFVAHPPGPRKAVVEALLPVSATKITKLPHYGAKRIRIVGKTNSVIVPITR